MWIIFGTWSVQYAQSHLYWLVDEIEDEGRSDTDGYSRRAKAGRSLTRLPCVLRLCAVQESR